MNAGKGSRGRFFEDFELGQELECPTPRALTSGEVAHYIALCGDRTPRFCGSEGLVHPLLTFHQVLGQTVRDVSLNARANLGYADLRWLRAVHVGALLRTRARVIGLKENSSRRHGIVWVETHGADAEGDVLNYTRWVMLHKRADDATRWLDAPQIPTLPEAVAPEALSGFGPIPSAANTGGRFFWEDYAPGERVLHHDGQTVTPSSHMEFTRLFQNTARVHFDATLGEPLVFGGYVLSLGYALAFNGFENRLGLAAINGGTHANPVHAGDTLFAFTDVLDRALLPGEPYGALRCRLVVVKGQAPSEAFAIMDGARRSAAVVLDLDFWELMPKREAL